MATEVVSDALAYLKKAESTGTGQSVYSHITQALQKILQQRPQDAVSIFETAFLPTGADYDAKTQTAIVDRKGAADAVRSLEHVRLFGDPVPALNEDGQPEDIPEPDEYAFFEPEAPEVVPWMMQLCGRGLNQSEMYSVLMTMKLMGGAAERKIEAVRFFGKIFGIEADYFIFECRMNERPEKDDADASDAELPPGQAPPESETGTNKYMYFVCNWLGGPLTLLPDVLPEQIRAARRVKKLLTGKLSAPVSAYPPFPGTELHYLRSQIARIAHATVLCPKGLFVAPEEGDGEPEANEEYQAIATGSMSDSSNWCHWTAHIKSMGVTVLPEIPEPEDEEHPPVLLPEQTEQGPPILTAASADAKVDNAQAWSPIRSSCSKNAKNQVAGVSSNLWPGAIAITNGKVWANAYVGWGIKRQAPFIPERPPPMAADLPPPQECDDLPPPPAAKEEEEE